MLPSPYVRLPSQEFILSRVFSGPLLRADCSWFVEEAGQPVAAIVANLQRYPEDRENGNL